jgi:DNA polymerase III delta prime subunit
LWSSSPVWWPGRRREIVQERVRKAFEDKGIQLLAFSSNLDFSDKVKQKIDSRNEVNTNVSVIDQQIIEQRKKNELARLQTEYNRIISEGLTDQILTKQFIDKWDGKTSLYGTQVPVTLMRGIK